MASKTYLKNVETIFEVTYQEGFEKYEDHKTTETVYIVPDRSAEWWKFWLTKWK